MFSKLDFVSNHNNRMKEMYQARVYKKVNQGEILCRRNEGRPRKKGMVRWSSRNPK